MPEMCTGFHFPHQLINGTNFGQIDIMQLCMPSCFFSRFFSLSCCSLTEKVTLPILKCRQSNHLLIELLDFCHFLVKTFLPATFRTLKTSPSGSRSTVQRQIVNTQGAEFKTAAELSCERLFQSKKYIKNAALAQHMMIAPIAQTRNAICFANNYFCSAQL